MAEDCLTQAELVVATGKSRAASQAAVLARLGVPFQFLGTSVRVVRAVAHAHAILPEARTKTGVDLSKVR